MDKIELWVSDSFRKVAIILGTRKLEMSVAQALALRATLNDAVEAGLLPDEEG